MEAMDGTLWTLSFCCKYCIYYKCNIYIYIHIYNELLIMHTIYPIYIKCKFNIIA